MELLAFASRLFAPNMLERLQLPVVVLLYICHSVPFLLVFFRYVYIRVCCRWVSMQRYREHSASQRNTAQRSHPWFLHKAAHQVRADQSTYQKIMYMHHACDAWVVFMEHGPLLALASRLFAPKILDHLHTTSAFPFHSSLWASRPIREAPCI